jgi:hypothetical protein
MTSVSIWVCVLAKRAVARRLLKEHLALLTLDRTPLTRALLGTPSLTARKWHQLDVVDRHESAKCQKKRVIPQAVHVLHVINLILYLYASMYFRRKLQTGSKKTLRLRLQSKSGSKLTLVSGNKSRDLRRKGHGRTHPKDHGRITPEELERVRASLRRNDYMAEK